MHAMSRGAAESYANLHQICPATAAEDTRFHRDGTRDPRAVHRGQPHHIRRGRRRCRSIFAFSGERPVGVRV